MEDEDIVYQTYKEELPEYMAGYTGHIPRDKEKKKFHYKIVPKKFIPGYTGHVSSIKSENKFGESYGKETQKSLKGIIPKGTDVPQQVRYISISRSNFIDQSLIKPESTAQLLGIKNRSVSYKKPLPSDAIDKFYGVLTNEKNKKISEKQNYEKDYLKFWEFLDSNDLDFTDKKKPDFKLSNMNYWGVKPSYMERYPQLKLEPIPGYMGNIRSVTAENVIGLSYMNSIKYINDLRKKEQEELGKNNEFN